MAEKKTKKRARAAAAAASIAYDERWLAPGVFFFHRCECDAAARSQLLQLAALINDGGDGDRARLLASLFTSTTRVAFLRLREAKMRAASIETINRSPVAAPIFLRHTAIWQTRAGRMSDDAASAPKAATAAAVVAVLKAASSLPKSNACVFIIPLLLPRAGERCDDAMRGDARRRARALACECSRLPRRAKSRPAVGRAAAN